MEVWQGALVAFSGHSIGQHLNAGGAELAPEKHLYGTVGSYRVARSAANFLRISGTSRPPAQLIAQSSTP